IANAAKKQSAYSRMTPEFIAMMMGNDPESANAFAAMAMQDGEFEALGNIYEGKANYTKGNIPSLVKSLMNQRVSRDDVMDTLIAEYPFLDNDVYKAQIAREVNSVYGKEKKGFFEIAYDAIPPASTLFNNSNQ